MLSPFSQTEMCFRDTLLMKSDATAFDNLVAEYGFPRPLWISHENWRNAIQSVLHGPRGTLHTLRAFLHHALMGYAIPFKWYCTGSYSQTTEVGGKQYQLGARTNFYVQSKYIGPGGSVGDTPLFYKQDLFLRELWFNKKVDSRHVIAPKIDPSDADFDPDAYDPTDVIEYEYEADAFLDENGDWISQDFLGYPEHPWKLHLCTRHFAKGMRIAALGFNTGYHTGTFAKDTAKTYNFTGSSFAGADVPETQTRLRYTEGDSGVGFLSPYAITERGMGFSSTNSPMAAQETAHVRIHVFIGNFSLGDGGGDLDFEDVFGGDDGLDDDTTPDPTGGLDGSSAGHCPQTYVVLGTPPVQPDIGGIFPQEEAEPHEIPGPGGGDRPEGQPRGAHLQPGALDFTHAAGDGGPHPPYLSGKLSQGGGVGGWVGTGTGEGGNGWGGGGANGWGGQWSGDVPNSPYEEGSCSTSRFTAAICKLIPHGVSWQLINGWGEPHEEVYGVADSKVKWGIVGGVEEVAEPPGFSEVP